MDCLVGQEKKGKTLGVGGGVGKEENFHLQPTHSKHKRALVINGKILIFSWQ